VRLYWPDRVERITGVPENDIVAATRMLAKAQRTMILTARGAEQHSCGTDTVQAFINLALALGLPGRPYCGFATITGQGNGQGGREHGQKCDQLPGYRKLVSDIFLSETAALADVVLPTAQWAEESGTMTNLEGRVILRRKAVASPGDVRSDLDVMADLAKRLGVQGFSADPEEIFDELTRASAGGKADYRGISYARIAAEKGVFWPCPSPSYPATARMFAQDFPTPDRLAHFHAVEQPAPAELPDDEFPYYLTTGRVLRQYQSGTQTRRVAQLAEAEPEPVVELHPTLAQLVGVRAGDKVRLRTRRGEVVMTARTANGIRPDTLFAPFHWGGAASINRLTIPVLDPHSRMPSFKVCAVALTRADTADSTDLTKGEVTHG
jgi:assimilatory nitrate reductase catalytic subunit